MRSGNNTNSAGFTLIELIVVVAIVATLLTLVAPNYFRSIDTAQDIALKQNLRILRSAIDQHFADHGRYPQSLSELASKRYVRSIPKDPITESNRSWVLVKHPNGLPGVYDLRSGAKGVTRAGESYSSL